VPSPTGTATGGTVAWLDVTCARRGVDKQALSAHTKPKGPIGYNTQYSDGSYYGDGHSQYSGGYSQPGEGFADNSGDFHATWLVPSNAPTGMARVPVVTQDGSIEVTFRIVAASGTCT